MGQIVFQTIIDNVKSFFGKEDELLQQPHKVPEAASEVYEHPGNSPQKIVEKPLEETPLPNTELPFTPDQLREALHKQEKPKEPQAEEPTTDELSIFDNVLEDVHDVEDTPPTPKTPEIPKGEELRGGYFDEFERFLMHEELDPNDLEHMDIIHRMKQFHKHQQEGKEYYVHSKEVQHAVQRKLSELKTLEHEWFHTKDQLDELQQGLTSIEREIETRTAEMKTLAHEAKQKTFLEIKVPKGREFRLQDGRKLGSLIELKISLHTMTDDMFQYHVTGKRNDFAEWIGTSMNNKELAQQIMKITDKHALDVFLGRLGR